MGLSNFVKNAIKVVGSLTKVSSGTENQTNAEFLFQLKNTFKINKSFNTSDLPPMLTEKFYISTYDCPLCN